MNALSIDGDSSRPVISLMGPTASGKTAIAMELVERFPVDIVSVDSAMIYRGMDIGTAKPSAEELAQAPHRLIDILDPAQSYSAAEFRTDAIREIDRIHAAGRIPLLVGGTMLYFKVLEQGIADMPASDPLVRERIEAEARAKGWEALHQRLQSIDPRAAERIHPNDPQRLQRALEVHELSGKTLSELHEASSGACSPFRFLKLGLMPEPRELLHERIEHRFNQMLEQGFVEEVRRLYERGDLHVELPSMRSVGYRQVWIHLAGEYDLDEARLKGVAATRQLAKRQFTWLRSWPGLLRLHSVETAMNDVLVALDQFVTDG